MRVLTKSRNDQKGPERTYNEQETTWSNPQQARSDPKQDKTSTARDDLKRPTMSKKWLKMIYKEWKKTWSDLKQPGENKKWLTYFLNWFKKSLDSNFFSKSFTLLILLDLGRSVFQCCKCFFICVFLFYGTYSRIVI